MILTGSFSGCVSIGVDDVNMENSEMTMGRLYYNGWQTIC